MEHLAVTLLLLIQALLCLATWMEKGEVEWRKVDRSVPEPLKHTPLTGASLQCNVTYWHEFVNTKPNFRTDVSAIYSNFFTF